MTKMTHSEAFVETLVKHKVTDVFGIVGSACMDALDLFPTAGIRYIPVVHEQGGGHMADGYSRASGKHGVCMAQNGPGITNFVTAIAAAYWAHSPVVMITPESGSSTMGLGGFQETEQLPIFSKITKYQGHVNNPIRMAEITSRCFDRAMLHMGPTQLNIPRDFFYGNADYSIPEPISIERGPGGEKSLNKAAQKLANAKFPVIVAGGGVIMSESINDCVKLAETLHAPVVNSYLHNDSFPASHPLWTGPLGYQGSKAAMKIIAQADVVIALGTRLGPFGTLPQFGIEYWPKNADIIQVDTDPEMIGLVRPVSVGICGDAGEFSKAIIKKINKQDINCLKNIEKRKSIIKNEKDNWEKELNNWKHETDQYSLDMIAQEPNKLHPREVLKELEKTMPSDAMVATDIGNICSVSNSYLRFEQPRSMFAAMSFGNCGYALPTAIGAKHGRPDRTSISYAGEGAWGMSYGEVLTSVRENIPVTAVVFNNLQWGAEKKNQVDFYNRRFVGTNLENPSFAAIAKEIGAEGIVIDKLSDVAGAFEQACKQQKNNNKTTVLEIMVSRELGDPFRRDALKKPQRLLKKYQHTNVD